MDLRGWVSLLIPPCIIVAVDCPGDRRCQRTKDEASEGGVVRTGSCTESALPFIEGSDTRGQTCTHTRARRAHIDHSVHAH